MHLSFVRSVSMDKWKDIELEKMKVYKTFEFDDNVEMKVVNIMQVISISGWW